MFWCLLDQRPELRSRPACSLNAALTRHNDLRPVHTGNFVAIFGNKLLPICCRFPQQFVAVFGNKLLPETETLLPKTATNCFQKLLPFSATICCQCGQAFMHHTGDTVTCDFVTLNDASPARRVSVSVFTEVCSLSGLTYDRTLPPRRKRLILICRHSFLGSIS